MKKTLSLVILFMGLIATSVFAESPLPQKAVWAEPSTAAAGEPITINVFVYNNQKEAITYTLHTKAGDSDKGNSIVTVAAGSAKTVTIALKQPPVQTVVTVDIVSALTKEKKDIVSLHGSIGVVLVGDTTLFMNEKELALPASATGMFMSIKTVVESFRVKYAEHFSTLRDSTRATINSPGSEIIPSTTAPAGVVGTEGIEYKRVDDPMDYATLIFATSMASLFSHPWMFYGTAFFLVFLLLRALFKLFI